MIARTQIMPCYCGGCPDCAQAQSYETEQCTRCNGTGRETSPDETRSRGCGGCAARGFVVVEEDEDG